MHQLTLPLPFDEDRVAPTSPAGPGPGLPAWESFPARDRQILVHLLVQAVRCRAPAPPTALLPQRG